MIFKVGRAVPAEAWKVSTLGVGASAEVSTRTEVERERKYGLWSIKKHWLYLVLFWKLSHAKEKGGGEPHLIFIICWFPWYKYYSGWFQANKSQIPEYFLNWLINFGLLSENGVKRLQDFCLSRRVTWWKEARWEKLLSVAAAGKWDRVWN